MPITRPNIVQTGEASRTALWVAKLRAAHQLLDEPIVLSDPMALPILGPQAEAELREDPFQYNDPISRGLRAAVIVRTRFAEDEVSRAVTAGVRQYVLLGAGLDTFAYRNPHANENLRVFEVDHASTQQRKQQSLKDAGIPVPNSLTFVPMDFEHGALASTLKKSGFQVDCPSCFSWLGVTVYLTEAAIMKTLGFVASLPKGSLITFDYRVSQALLNPIERVINEVMGQRAATAGEPWISAFEPSLLREQVLGLGFSQVETYEPDELNRLYLSRRKDGLCTGGRLICARV